MQQILAEEQERSRKIQSSLDRAEKELVEYKKQYENERKLYTSPLSLIILLFHHSVVRPRLIVGPFFFTNRRESNQSEQDKKLEMLRNDNEQLRKERERPGRVERSQNDKSNPVDTKKILYEKLKAVELKKEKEVSTLSPSSIALH